MAKGRKKEKKPQGVDTGGGAYVANDVVVTGGDFVGRDKYEQYYFTGQKLEIPFQAPALPTQYYVERPDLNRLKELLLPSKEGAPPPVAWAVLHGLPAVGKSVLAAAFAHDEAVRKVFPDGVLWAPLGTAPDLPRRLADWGRALGDPSVMKGPYADEQAGTSGLRTRLREKACLLIVDDAWKEEHVRPFLAGGPRCLLLVTSRKRGILPGAAEIPLAEMREEEALTLMANWAGEMAEADRATAAWLAHEVGCLPLALVLIAAQARPPSDWAKVRQRWERERLAAVKRGRDPKKKEDSLLISLELSLEALKKDDHAAYLQLGVFPKDTSFPVSAAATLWGWNESRAEEFLVDLAGQALLAPRLVAGVQRYTFQNVLYDFVVDRLGEEALSQAHMALVAGYRARCGGEWAKLAPDGYVHDHLARHMAAGRLVDDLDALIDRAWMQVQLERVGSHRAFAEDVKQAISAAGQATPIRWMPLVRGSVVFATLVTMAANIPSSLRRVLAQIGLKSQARDHASLVQDAESRCYAYLLVADGLLSRQEASQAALVLEEALATAQLIEKPDSKASLLSDIAQDLIKAGQASKAAAVARQALAATEGMEQSHYGKQALAAVAVALAKTGASSQSLDTIQAIEGDWWERKEPLAQIAVILAEVGQAEQVLAAAKAMAEDQHAELPCEVAQALGRANRVDLALRVLQETEHGYSRAFEMSLLAGVLAKEGMFSQALRVVEEVAEVTEDGRPRDLFLFGLRLPKSWGRKPLDLATAVVQERALESVLEILAWDKYRDQVPTVAEQAVVVARTLDTERWRIKALSQIAQVLAAGGYQRQAADVARSALSEAKEIHEFPVRFQAEGLSHAAAALALAGQKAEAVEAAARALALIKTVQHRLYDWEVFAEVGQAYAHASEPDLALAVAGEIEGKADKAVVLSMIAAALAQAGHNEHATRAAEEALTLVREVEALDQKARDPLAAAVAYNALAWVGMYSQALTLAATIQDAEQKVNTFRAIAYLWAEQGAMEQARAAVEGMGDPGENDKELGVVAHNLALQGMHEKSLIVVRGIRDQDYQAGVLRTIAYTLGLAGAYAAASEAVEAIEFEGRRAEALSGIAQGLARILTRDQLTAALKPALEVTGRMQSSVHGAAALSGIAQALLQAGEFEQARALASQALELAETVGHETYVALTFTRMAEALADVGATDLAGGVAEQVLAMIDTAGSRNLDALRASSEILARAGKLATALSAVQQLENPGDQVDVLSAIAVILASQKGSNDALVIARQALATADTLEEQGQKAQALSAVAHAFAAAGAQDQALALAEQAVTAATAAEGSQRLAVAQALARAGLADQACRAARTIEESQDRLEAQASVALALAKGEQKDRAAALAQEVQAALESLDNFRKEIVLADVAEVQAFAGRPDDAMAAARAIKDGWHKAWTLRRVAQALAESGQEYWPKAEQALQEADSIEPGRKERPAATLQAPASPGQQVQVLSELKRVFSEAMSRGRQSMFTILRGRATVLARIDQGQTLGQVTQAVMDIETTWWSST